MRANLDDPSAFPVRTVFGLAWPLTLKAIMLHGVVVIDTYLVSALGESAVAALGLAAAIAGLLLGVLLSFSNATQIRIAQAAGTGSPSFLKSALFAGLVINAAASAIGLIVLALLADPIIGSLAHNSWIADQAKLYLMVFAVVIAAESIHQCLTAYFNGTGDTRLSLYSYMLGVPINVSVSIIFIYGHFGLPELGIVGAAVGSATAAVTQTGFLSYRLWTKTGFYLGVSGWRNGTLVATLRRHLSFSWPIAATFISATATTNVCMLIYAKLDVNSFAAMTLIMPWVQVAGTVGMSWAQATGIIVAQLLGSDRRGKQLDRFLRGAWRAAFVAAGMTALVYATIILLTPWLYSELHPDTRATLISFWPVLLLLPFPKGSNAICGNTLRAAGETVYVMHIFIWSQWLFRVPLTAILVLYFEVPVVWVLSLLLLEELVKLPPFHSRLHRGDWKKATVEA